ncbi:unnamed protein product [Nezara viridula]|uniref:Uncharacterized protein n=1 Tax=Nezara viridula TaxID=85310 RepID=A0A9P0HKI5_NEZVI|nr:unnamed protein product [Nezara viridula]
MFRVPCKWNSFRQRYVGGSKSQGRLFYERVHSKAYFRKMKGSKQKVGHISTVNRPSEGLKDHRTVLPHFLYIAQGTSFTPGTLFATRSRTRTELSLKDLGKRVLPHPSRFARKNKCG